MYANHTLPKTNSEFSPENGWLEDAFPFRKAYFTGPCWFQGGSHPNFHVSCSTPTTFHCLHLMMCPNIVPLSSICIVFWYSGRVHINKQTSDFVFTSTNISNNNTPFSDGFSSQQFDTTKHPPNTTPGPLIKAQVDETQIFFLEQAGGPVIKWPVIPSSHIDCGLLLKSETACVKRHAKSIKISSNTSKGAGKSVKTASKKGILPWFINYSTTYQLPSIFIT